MHDTTLHRAFPIVAAAIGHRFGVQVRVGGQQARTDGRVIQLPAYDGDDPDYRDYAWGLLAHEALHLRHSDFTLDLGDSLLRRHLCGAIEDVRIEHAGAKDWPGTKATIRTVIDKLIATGQFRAPEADEHPAAILVGFVLLRLRADVLGQRALTPLAEAAEAVLANHFPPGVRVRLHGLLSEVPDGLRCEADCLALADRILTMVEDEVRAAAAREPEPEPPSDRKTPTAEENGDATVADETATADADAGSGPEQPQANAPSAPSGPDPSKQDGSDAGPPEEPPAASHLAEPNVEPEPPETMSPDAAENWLQTLHSATDSDLAADVFEAVKSALALEPSQCASLCLPDAVEPPAQPALGSDLYQRVRADSVKLRATLHGVVQAHRRDRPVRKAAGRRLASRHLYRRASGETRLFVRTTHRVQPNTALHLLIDRSDSMDATVFDPDGHALGSRLSLAIEAAAALTLALETLPGVNPAVTAFPGPCSDAVYRLLRHGERLSSRIDRFALAAEGDTPMGAALWYAAAALCQCTEPRRVILVLTDGRPTDRLVTARILRQCREAGIEVIGIGLGVDVTQVLPQGIVIHALHELRTQCFALARQTLLGR